MTTKDLKVGSIVEIPVSFSPERMNIPTQVKIKKCTDFYLWFDHNSLQRMGRHTFEVGIKFFNYKIITL